MTRLRNLAASLLAATALLAVPAADSRAEIGIRFHTGFGGGHHGHGGHHKRFQHGHGGHHRRYQHDHRDHHRGHRAPPRSRFGSHHHPRRDHGFASRHPRGPACRLVTRPLVDRHGYRVLRRETLCLDRHGHTFSPRHRRHHH